MMTSIKLLNEILTLAAPEILLQMTSDPGLMEIAKNESQHSWAVCQTLINLCTKLKQIILSSPLARDTVASVYTEQFERCLLGHLQNITDKRDILSVVENILNLHRHFASGSKYSVALESILNDVLSDSLQVATTPTRREWRFLSTESFATVETAPKKNLAKGSYESLENYLEIHFSLLRCDFFIPLANGLKKFCGESTADWSLIDWGRAKLLDIKPVYDKTVSVLKLLDRNDVDLGRLLPGSLAVLNVKDSRNENVFMLGTVHDKKVGNLLEICLLSTKDYVRLVRLLESENVLRIFEAPIYFEAYRHVLRVLQTTREIPFPRSIVEADFSSPTLDFISDHVDIDLAALSNKPTTSRENRFYSAEEVLKLLRGVSRVVTDETKLQRLCNLEWEQRNFIVNPSQLEAIKHAMTNRLALIQGPPGTGKSYVGQLLFRILLSNRAKLWPDSNTGLSILIVCFTNRALDSFLESALGVTRKVVRIGSRSKSEKLESHNLSALKKYCKETSSKDPKLYKLERNIESELSRAREHLSLLCEKLSSKQEADDFFCQQWDESQSRFVSVASRLEDIRDVESVMLCRNADIIGMTTSGAAKYRKFVEMLQSKVVIIEEAGQVLEAHVLSALTPSCEKLILIGDHQQLRPTVSTYYPGQTHELDISLFERLVSNDISYVKLDEQHRMRPEISNLMKSIFYPALKDHASVYTYPEVKACVKNLFFVRHEAREEKVEAGSKVNVLEATFLLNLARHLVAFGNDPKKITLLTGYSGQMLYMMKLRDENFPDLRDAIITVIDNYQGEENDIILLSLVRSNDEGKIGFLSTAGRVCVALSRARLGLFVIGNLKELSLRSELWSKIENYLESSDSIGPFIELCCPYHREIRKKLRPGIEISQIDGLRFCEKVCGETLFGCEHTCSYQCHDDDRDHRHERSCRRKCDRLCSEGHPCDKICSERCFPCMWRDPVKTKLTCGHEINLPCASVSSDLHCEEMIVRKLLCGHVKKSTCGSMSDECNERCDVLLDCGHPCDIVCKDHAKTTHNTKCLFPCGKNKLGCSVDDHPKCQKACFQLCEPCALSVDARLPCGHTEVGVQCCTDPESLDCNKKCGKPLSGCEHTCKSYCYQCRSGCSPCAVPVTKSLPCGHTARTLCSFDASLLQCNEPCTKALAACGHLCPNLCSDPCENAVCKVLVESSGVSSCNHKLFVTCGARNGIESSANDICQESCDKVIKECGHRCVAKCCDCFSGLVHLPCASKCERVLICGHVCELPCGVPCQPCAKKKCNFQFCKHAKCKSKCEDPCTSCKEKCGFHCDHSEKCCGKKCSKCCDHEGCPQPCSKTLACGHSCPSFCGEVCPDSKHCPCCGHVITENEMSRILDSSKVGMPICPQCSIPIQFFERFKKKLWHRKSQVVEVFEIFFAKKTKVAQLKKEIIESIEGKNLIPSFSAYILDRCQDRRNLVTFFEAQNWRAKIKLLQILASVNCDIATTAIKFLQLGSSSVDHRYISNLLDVIGKNQYKTNFVDFLSFSLGSWTENDEGHPTSTPFSCTMLTR